MTDSETDRDVDPGAGQATEVTVTEKDERQQRIEDYLLGPRLFKTEILG